MKYWNKKDKDNNEIFLKDNGYERVLSLYKWNGKINFAEQCDNCFGVDLSNQDAIKALEEAIEWIKEDGDV